MSSGHLKAQGKRVLRLTNNLTSWVYPLSIIGTDDSKTWTDVLIFDALQVGVTNVI